MEFNQRYMIIEPFQLPWMYVSPTDDKGLEYHLSPELSIRLNGIISGDTKFIVSHVVMAIEGMEVNELQAEQMFLTEFLPGKSKERIRRAFKDGQNSCFFTTKQMTQLEQLFTDKNFMSYDVMVYYKDKKVDDIVYLPPKEFNRVLEVFDELHVHGNFDYKKSKDELKADYEENLKTKVASMEDKANKSIWERISNKGVKKRMAIGTGSLIVGIAGILIRTRLNKQGGWISLVASLIIGVVGVLGELYGRHELQTIMRVLQTNRTERMFT